MAAYAQAASRDWECASSWQDLRKVAGIERVVTASYIKELVEKQAKTHKEVSGILRQGYNVVLLQFFVFTSHVIETKNRNHSINKFKNMGYDR